MMYIGGIFPTSEIIIKVVIPHWMAISVLSHSSSWKVFSQHLYKQRKKNDKTHFHLSCNNLWWCIVSENSVQTVLLSYIYVLWEMKKKEFLVL